MPLHADFNEQRNDKGRGRQAAEGQVFREKEFRHIAGGGHAFLGRGGQDCVDEVRGEAERQRREFCSGKGGEMTIVFNFICLVFCILLFFIISFLFLDRKSVV